MSVSGVDSVDAIVGVRFANVPLTYARELDALGYTRLVWRLVGET